MMTSPRPWLAVGSALVGLAVVCGAFGAHALKDRLGEYSGVYDKAVFYHVVHALGILVVSVLVSTGLLPLRRGRLVCAMFLGGIFLFSGSLYLLAITRVTVLGAITPFGGALFIAAWFLLAWAVAKIQ